MMPEEDEVGLKQLKAHAGSFGLMEMICIFINVLKWVLKD